MGTHRHRAYKAGVLALSSLPEVEVIRGKMPEAFKNGGAAETAPPFLCLVSACGGLPYVGARSITPLPRDGLFDLGRGLLAGIHEPRHLVAAGHESHALLDPLLRPGNVKGVNAARHIDPPARL